MNKNPMAWHTIALLWVLVAGTAHGECRIEDDPASSCRYPAGDAWCARHGDGNPYAYKDDCAQESARTEHRTTTRPPATSGSWSPTAEWDCAKARTVVEHLICANPELRAQDSRMGALYARLRSSGLAPERAQKAWLLERRNACDDVDCLRAVYAERLRDLEQLAGPEETPAQARVPETARTAPPPAKPQARERAPEPTPEPPAGPAAEPALLPALAPSQDLSTQVSGTGIPELPPPEGPVWRPAAAPSSNQGAGPPRVQGPGFLPVGLSALGVALGLLVWYRRHIRTAIAPVRQHLARLNQRTRAPLCTARTALRARRATAPSADQRDTRPAAAVPETPHRAVGNQPDPHLPAEVVARLSALAQPGEPLAAVIERAVAALEALSAADTPDPVLSRLATLEARLAQLEGTPEPRR